MSEDTTAAVVDAQDNTDAPPASTAVDTQQTPDTKADDLLTDAEPKEPEVADDLLADDKADDKSDDDKEDSKAPEKYEAFTVEEGEDIKYKISDEQHEEISELGKELGLSQPEVQKIISFDIKRERLKQQNQQKQTAAVKTENAIAIRKEHGEGFNEAQGLAKKAFNTYFTKTLQDVFVKSGLSNDPELFKTLVKIGKTIGEDTLVTGDSMASTKEFNVKQMYDKSNHK